MREGVHVDGTTGRDEAGLELVAARDEVCLLAADGTWVGGNSLGTVNDVVEVLARGIGQVRIGSAKAACCGGDLSGPGWRWRNLAVEDGADLGEEVAHGSRVGGGPAGHHGGSVGDPLLRAAEDGAKLSRVLT